MGADDLLARLGRNGALRPLARMGVERSTGLAQVLTARAAIDAVAADPAVTVPYGERSWLLGLQFFPLAQDGVGHATARQLIADVVAATDDRHQAGVAVAGAVAADALVRAGRQVDVVETVVDPALAAWVEHWFGLPGHGTTLLRAGRLILHATFWNPQVPSGPIDVEGLRRAIELVGASRQDLAPAMADAPAGTVAAELLARTGATGSPVDHLLGLTVGPLALGTWALDQVIDRLLDRPWEPAGLGAGAPRAKLLADAADRYLATLPAVAPLPGILRVCPAPSKVPGAEPGGPPVDVPAGTALLHTRLADRDRAPAGDGAPEPRPLAFGTGGHACLGPQQITDVSATVLHELGTRSPARVEGARGELRPGEGPSGIADWPFPGHLHVALRS